MGETGDISNRNITSCLAGPPLDLDLNEPSTSGIRNRGMYLHNYNFIRLWLTDDLVRVAGIRWMQDVQDRSLWRRFGEAYVQQ